MKLVSLLGPIAAACLALPGAGVQAAGLTYDVRVTNLSIEVIDLTPNDGIAAGYEFVSPGQTSYSVGLGQPGYEPESGYYRSAAAVPGSYSLNQGASSVSSGSTGRLGDFTMASTLTGPRGAGAYAFTSVSQIIQIELQPNTAIVLAGHVYQSLTALPGTSWYDDGDLSTWIYLEELGGAGGYARWGTGLDLHGSRTEVDADFHVILGNVNSGAMRTSLEISLDGEGHIGAVPEPSTYAMLLTGAFIVGASLRRARKPVAGNSMKGA